MRYPLHSEQPIVAIAGGTGGFGRTIVEKLREKSSYGVVVLSREVWKDIEWITQEVY